MLREILAETASHRAIAILGRYPTDADRKDGYYQRVQTIDGLLAPAFSRIYFRSDARVTRLAPQLTKLGKRLYVVRYSRRNPLHVRFAAELARRCGSVYAHSILILQRHAERLLFTSAEKRILDLHGAVPEEQAYMGATDRSVALGRLEQHLVQEATCLVGVTHSLLNHINTKYLHVAPHLIALPNLAPSVELVNGERIPGSVIYAGGLQPWQQVDKMLNWINLHPEADVAFLTPDAQELDIRYRREFGRDFPGVCVSIPSEEIVHWYARYGFGLILREDCTVNRVACPTKLGEYLDAGVVPIVDSPLIGDFASAGMASVSLSDPLPDEETRKQMVATNRKVMAMLRDTLVMGHADLMEYLSK